jgi:hypothetical protein
MCKIYCPCFFWIFYFIYSSYPQIYFPFFDIFLIFLLLILFSYLIGGVFGFVRYLSVRMYRIYQTSVQYVIFLFYSKALEYIIFDKLDSYVSPKNYIIRCNLVSGNIIVFIQHLLEHLAESDSRTITIKFLF